MTSNCVPRILVLVASPEVHGATFFPRLLGHVADTFRWTALSINVEGRRGPSSSCVAVVLVSSCARDDLRDGMLKVSRVFERERGVDESSSGTGDGEEDSGSKMVLIFAMAGLATTEEGINCNADVLKTPAVGGGVNKSAMFAVDALEDSSSLFCGFGESSGREG